MTQKKYSLLIICLLCLLPMLMQGQPENLHQHYGCRHSKSLIKMEPLTPEEKLLQSQSNARSDTIDILNYNITLDVTGFSTQTIKGICELTFTPKVDEVDDIVLDLLQLNIDSIKMDEVPAQYTYDGDLIDITFDNLLNIGDTVNVTIYYGGQPTTAAGGFGGFDFASGIAYNLGIGLGENPYNFGRGWFPCFDNFVERATYDLNVMSSDGRKAYCIGTFLGEEVVQGDSIMRRFRMNQPLPTYLVGVAVSDYTTVDYVHTGAYGDVPVQLVGRPFQIDNMENTFIYLNDCIDELEAWYGPYIWERVGFVLTPRGAMEHCTNIAYPIASGTGGPTAGGNGLMAHELAHHWWGNMLTLSGPENMWIKEGNAEYGSHLFTEYVFGKEAFINQVKTNHQDVMRTAHVQDDGYHPLSGIPYEHTYGKHTYDKGASMLHNMRAYLGDTLFRSAQQAVLDEYLYQSIDAETYRDHLTLASGVDMTSFFEDWIFSPGHSNFEIESITVTPTPTLYEVELQVQQKGRGTDHFHTNVPLVVLFGDDNWNFQTEEIMVSGEFSTVTVMLPFAPTFQALNPNNELNLARLNNIQTVTEAGSMNKGFINMIALDAVNVPDSALISVVHHWTNADDAIDPAFRMSDRHYWTVSGIIPDGFEMKGTINYSGNNENAFDYDLVNITDDSLIVMWRPTPMDEWEVYPHQDKLDLGSTGLYRLDPLLPGEYAYANTDVTVNTNEVIQDLNMLVYPNPTAEKVLVEGKLEEGSALQIQIVDLSGKLVSSTTVNAANLVYKEEIDVTVLPNGLYNLQVVNARNEVIAAEKLTVSR